MIQTIKILEDQIKETQVELEGTADKFNQYEKSIQDKANEIEEIRKKITKVAELYERKPITQKYNFEVLCDFITDKAKRLFEKYELLSKEKKVIKEEKISYY